MCIGLILLSTPKGVTCLCHPFGIIIPGILAVTIMASLRDFRSVRFHSNLPEKSAESDRSVYKDLSRVLTMNKDKESSA